MLMFLFVSLSLTLHDNVLSSHKLCLTVCCSFLNLSVKSNLMVSIRQQVFACGFVVCVQIDYYQQQDLYTLRLSSFCVLFKASTSSTTKTRIFLSKQYQSKYTFPFRAFNKPRVSGGGCSTSLHFFCGTRIRDGVRRAVVAQNGMRFSFRWNIRLTNLPLTNFQRPGGSVGVVCDDKIEMGK